MERPLKTNENTALPPHWKAVKLGEVCKVLLGQSPPSDTYNSEAKGLPFFQGKKEFTELYPVAVKWCSTPIRIAEPNDILLSVRAPVGALNIANVKCCIGRGLAAIRYDPNYKFLYYYLRSIARELETQGTGSTFKAISGNIIRSFRFPLPPLPEQRRIVARIEELFSELDNGIANLKKAREQLKTYRQAVLKQAFEGKLTEEWRKNRISNIEYRIPNIEVSKEAEKESSYGKDKELPDGWTEVLLEDITSVITDGDHQPPPKSVYGIPFITISNVNKKYNTIDFTSTHFVSADYYNSLKAYRKPIKGDILYTVTGSFGIPILINYNKRFCFQRHIGLVRPSESTNQKWLYYILQSPQIFSQAENTATGTAQKTVSLKSLRNFTILLPAIREQLQIVREIESRLSVAGKLEGAIDRSLQQAETLRQSILKRAFEGKLVEWGE